MRLKFLMAAMLLAAMGPGRSEPPPEAGAPPPVIEYDLDADADAAMSPEEAAAVVDPEPVPELRIIDAGAADPGAFQWVSRLVVVFADTPNDPAFVDQMRALQTRPEPLIERDVVVITEDLGTPGALEMARGGLLKGLGAKHGLGPPHCLAFESNGNEGYGGVAAGDRWLWLAPG